MTLCVFASQRKWNDTTCTIDKGKMIGRSSIFKAYPGAVMPMKLCLMDSLFQGITNLDGKPDFVCGGIGDVTGDLDSVRAALL